MRKLVLRWVVLILLVYLLYLWYFPNGLYGGEDPIQANMMSYLASKLRANYAEEIEEICQAQKIPSEYFKALAILECSAEKPPKSRYEPKVYERLREVKEGKKPAYGSLKHAQLKDLSPEQLKDMATSWGVFQLMGYHAYGLDIAPRDLEGAEGIRLSIIWIEKAYGQYIRKGDFANAFHIHNTGKPIVNGEYETYSADYIPRGLEYIKLFQEERVKKETQKVEKTDTVKQK